MCRVGDLALITISASPLADFRGLALPTATYFPAGKESLARSIPRTETLIMFQFKGAESCCGKLKLFIINDAHNK